MKKEKTSKRIVVLLVSLVLLCIVTVGGAMAYIISRTDALRNEFVPVRVTCEIKETFVNNVKKDVHIKNAGDIDAYVRATVIANWVSDDNKAKIHSSTPKEGVDYSVEWGNEGWKKSSDGFWYFEQAVPPQEVTTDLIETSTTITEAPKGYHLQIQILTSAIQSMPKEVVEEEWGVIVENGLIIIQ